MGMKEFRKREGLTQKEAADLFGIKWRTYQNYENGTTSPDLNMAAKFAVHFNCTIGELFDLEEGADVPNTPIKETLIANFDLMNEAGQEKLVDYSNDLIASGNYMASPNEL